VAVGDGMALLVTNPLVVNLITNALAFVVLLFTPIVYPASKLPAVMMRIHEVLPFYPMAQLIRAGLTGGIVTDVSGPFLTVGV